VSIPESLGSCPPGATGRLILGATPLGQPGDASKRLVDALATADVVAAEDTRRVRSLAQSLDVRIGGRVVSLFDQNEAARVPALVDDIKAGATVLVVSDAGMPLINDPGYRMVTACIEAGVPVSCLPGPSAVTTALAVSGLPSDRFCFEGFAPRKQSARKAWLAGLAAEQRTCVFFESPRRLADCLHDAVDELGGQRRVVVCRELTKVHEEVVRGRADELAARYESSPPRGEVVLVIGGAPPRSDIDPAAIDALRRLVDAGARPRPAAGVVAELTGAPANALYRAVVEGA
jgi:16S rRNA (cytidine1402-2'-O)-methyltransferase